MAISRDKARQRTRAARLGALVFLAAAGAVAAFPLPAVLKSAPPAPPPVDVGAQTPTPAGKADQSVDSIAITSTMWALNPPVQHDSAPAVAAGTGDKPEEVKPPSPPPPSGEWRYVGSIVGPRTTHAMISIDGDQHLLAAGSELGGVRLLSVDPQQIIIQTSGATKTVALSARETAWPDARASSKPPIAAGAPGKPGNEPALDEQLAKSDPAEYKRRMEARNLQVQTAAPPGTVVQQPMRPTPVPGEAGQPPRRPLPIGAPGGAGARH